MLRFCATFPSVRIPGQALNNFAQHQILPAERLRNMSRAAWSFTSCLFIAALTPLLVHAQGAGCTGSSGSRFNLEPRPSAVVQVAQSVAFLPNRAGKHNLDLLVATAADARGLDTNANPTIASSDAFYVQRSAGNCLPDFEGGEVASSKATSFSASSPAETARQAKATSTPHSTRPRFQATIVVSLSPS
jgi:hypothetical protein